MTLKEKLAAAQAQRVTDDNATPAAQAFNAMFSGARISHTDNKQIVMLPVDKLHPFAGHTFQLHEGSSDYLSLSESIRRNGIQEPVIVRAHPKIPGEYEIIVGHRRHHIASVECDILRSPVLSLPLMMLQFWKKSRTS